MMAGIAAVALCAATGAEAKKKKKKEETPPPPPVVVVIPPQPRPPLGAPATMTIPPRDATTGERSTINSALSVAQTTWNLRAAYNVAALSCLQPQHAQILVNYRTFLKTHLRGLAAANRLVDGEFRTRFGPRFIPPREKYMTQVYNYFALPPTMPAFCDAALAMSTAGAAIKPAQLNTFSAAQLITLDRVFRDFFNSYDQYRTDLAAWQARYAPTQPAPIPVVAGGAPAAATTQPVAR